MWIDSVCQLKVERPLGSGLSVVVTPTRICHARQSTLSVWLQLRNARGLACHLKTHFSDATADDTYTQAQHQSVTGGRYVERSLPRLRLEAG